MEGTSIAVLCMDKPAVLSQTTSLLRDNLIHPYEVIVVDNGSTNEETLTLLDYYEREEGWTVIHNETNLGLSVGTNQGLEKGKYDCLIHLDDDCIIGNPGWNQTMRKHFEIEKVGLVVPQQPDESIRHEQYRELRWALGMCWAIRKDLFDDIGGYDPQLYHQNECDLALRVRMAGYHVAGIGGVDAIHNDPGGHRSDVSLAREHIGCVQFRDKWCSYFRGRDWNYGTQPLYLMQHWPPDQEFLRQFAWQEGLDLNPPPLGLTDDHKARWIEFDKLAGETTFQIHGQNYMIFREIRNEYSHWEHRYNSNGYLEDRELAIARWLELTGDRYEGYKWPVNLLRPY